jgi:hypothetical protein
MRRWTRNTARTCRLFSEVRSHDTLTDDPHVDADTPAVDSEVRNSYLLFISVSLQ